MKKSFITSGPDLDWHKLNQRSKVEEEAHIRTDLDILPNIKWEK